uniref:hypothetical protein n=1 Tax=Salmonella enterica TaxID=28901 RepID=UPI0032967FFC
LGAWVAYNTGAYRQHLQRGGLVGAIRKARESGGALPPINVTVNTRTVVLEGALNSRRIETIAESVVVGHARSNRQH